MAVARQQRRTKRDPGYGFCFCPGKRWWEIEVVSVGCYWRSECEQGSGGTLQMVGPLGPNCDRLISHSCGAPEPRDQCNFEPRCSLCLLYFTGPSSAPEQKGKSGHTPPPATHAFSGKINNSVGNGRASLCLNQLFTRCSDSSSPEELQFFRLDPSEIRLMQRLLKINI